MNKYMLLSKLKELLLMKRALSVSEIIGEINVSEPTARRYINQLVDTNDNFYKILNGITLKDEMEHNFEEKLSYNREKKIKIAKKMCFTNF